MVPCDFVILPRSNGRPADYYRELRGGRSSMLCKMALAIQKIQNLKTKNLCNLELRQDLNDSPEIMQVS